MKKEIGKWLMDIAKYVATAIIISSFLGSLQHKWMVYFLGFLIVIVCGLIGLYLINYKEK
jgi:ABC-type multidrug transport system permease subunit